MTTLTTTEAAILEQLREKPMEFESLFPEGDFEALHVMANLYTKGRLRTVNYHQIWRAFRSMTICHLTHEGRLALIAWEKEQSSK